MTPQEVKAVALARAIQTLADLGVTYTVEDGASTYTNRKPIKRTRVLDWSRYEVEKRLRAAKAGDIVTFDNDGDELLGLQKNVSGKAGIAFGHANFKTEQLKTTDQVVCYVFASPTATQEAAA